MGRAIVGVIVGYVVWTAIWLGATLTLFAAAAARSRETGRFDETGPLIGLVVTSIVCSLAAGLCCGMIAKAKSRGAVLTLAGLLLATGIAVQAAAWSTMPLWYHLTFLFLLVPMTIAGATIVCGNRKVA